MKVKAMFHQPAPLVSFEFFPPKTEEGLANLMETMGALKEFKPSYVSMTYGAGGSTRQKTVQLVSDIRNNVGIETVAHLTCVGHTRSELTTLLQDLESAGIENILALRGDPPKGQSSYVPTADGFSHASDLVRLIKSKFGFSIGVAGYPEKHIEAPTFAADVTYLKEKVDAGADFVVTQLFFSNDDYFRYVERLRSVHVTVPVVAGIMPITDVDQIKRFAVMCGAKIPQELLHKLDLVKRDKEAVVRAGIDHATHQCEELLRRKIPGIHFYTLNKSKSTKEIFLNLRKKGLLA